MHISREELRAIFARIVRKLEEDGVETIALEDDYYRIIPTDEWSSVADDPVIETGSLHDDIVSLKRLLVEDQRPCSYVDFDRLASALRAISQHMNPP